jgi:radical SAM protein with 4Fe4S-binding SPASM domain
MPEPSPSAKFNALTLERGVPAFVTAELTRRCPLVCRHCYLPETRGRAAAAPELNTAAWKRILEDIAGAGGLYLAFTGGEPLLRPDLPELCAFARGLRFDVRVFSSGHGLTPELAAALAAAGISAFEISVYGRPGTHETITGSSGSFGRSLAAAKLMRGCGVPVRLKMPLMADNSAQAGWVEKLAEAEGFTVSFDPVIAPANDGDGAALKHRLGGRPLAAAVARLDRAPAVAQEPYPLSFDLLCGAGRNVCAVGPDGTLYPCLQLPVKLGNLARRGFRDIWSSSRWLKKWRAAGEKDLKGCAGCADSAFCSRCPGISLLEEGDLFAPNKPACEMAAARRRNKGKRTSP